MPWCLNVKLLLSIYCYKKTLSVVLSYRIVDAFLRRILLCVSVVRIKRDH